MLVDVHCHLDHVTFSGKLDAVIANARKAGMKAIVTSGVNTPTNRVALELSKKYDIVKCTLGLYPTDLLGMGADEAGIARQEGKFDIDAECAFIKKHKDEILGIGEVGLDYYWDKERHAEQKKNFEKILSFAEKLKKPVVIHSRQAEKDCIDMLESSRLKRVDLHCFMGNKKLIKRAEDLGVFFSIPALIVRLQHFQMLVEQVSLSHVLTETDAPFLSPVQNEKSEPLHVQQTVKMIAKIKKLDESEVEKNIFMNYQRLFLS